MHHIRKQTNMLTPLV